MEHVAPSVGTGRHWIQVAPAAAALIYPALLAGAYHAAHLLLSGGAAAGKVLDAVTLAVCLVLILAVLAVAFGVAVQAAQLQGGTRAGAHARVIAHLAFASPALFTFLGVIVYLAGFPSADYIIWALFWLGVMVWTLLPSQSEPAIGGALQAPSWLRPIHGIAAALLIAGFISLHLFNHLTGFWSAETHIEVMEVLRHWYRSTIVEPLLVVLMLFMAVSGGILLRARLTRPASLLETLQTVTGAYLAVYIIGHMNSVFVYARLHDKIETDFWFASGGKAGLFGDPWSVRLLPHYAVGVWCVITHAGCGLRTVLLTHGVSQGAADRVAAWISLVGVAVAIPMILALLRVHLA